MRRNDPAGLNCLCMAQSLDRHQEDMLQLALLWVRGGGRICPESFSRQKSAPWKVFAFSTSGNPSVENNKRVTNHSEFLLL